MRETKTRTEIEAETVEEVTYRSTARAKEVEIPGTRCDFCDQWYSDEEGIYFREMVEEPRVALGLGSQPMRLYQLLEHIDVTKIHEPMTAQTVGSEEEFLVGYEAQEVNDVVGLKHAIREYVESRGGPAYDPLRDENIRASGAHGRLDSINEGDIVFTLNIEPEIKGDTYHMCQYCVESREEE